MLGIVLIVVSTLLMAVSTAIITTCPICPVAWRHKTATAIFLAWCVFIFAVAQHWIVD